MNVRRKSIGLIQRTYANEAQMRSSAGIMTPQRDVARRTTQDHLPFAAIGGGDHRDRGSLQKGHTARLDECVERIRRSGLALTPAAVTAVDEQWFTGEPIPYRTAITTAFDRRPLGLGLIHADSPPLVRFV